MRPLIWQSISIHSTRGPLGRQGDVGVVHVAIGGGRGQAAALRAAASIKLDLPTSLPL